MAKSEAASALATLSGLKTNTETYTLENGIFPDQAQSSAIGIPASPMGNIVLTPVTGTSGAGSIIYSFTSGNVSPDLSGKGISLARDKDGKWTCKRASALEANLVPKSCKTATY